MYLVAVEEFEPPTSQMVDGLWYRCQLMLGIFLCSNIIYVLYQMSYTAHRIYISITEAV